MTSMRAAGWRNPGLRRIRIASLEVFEEEVWR
jgi:hypothetical protein